MKEKNQGREMTSSKSVARRSEQAKWDWKGEIFEVRVLDKRNA